jgi:hypothetical protein
VGGTPTASRSIPRVAERLRALPAAGGPAPGRPRHADRADRQLRGPATLAAAIEPYAALTDDQPITEYASVAAHHHELPPTLFDVTRSPRGVRAASSAATIRDAADPPAHLALLGRVRDPAFREYYRRSAVGQAGVGPAGAHAAAARRSRRAGTAGGVRAHDPVLGARATPPATP